MRGYCLSKQSSWLIIAVSRWKRKYRMQQVFISYAPQDKGRAEQVYVYLERAGLHPWRYDADLRPGEDWAVQIEEALRQSTHCVVLLSPSSIKSPAVASEYRHFLAQNKPVIPAL